MTRIGAFLGCPSADAEFGRPESSLYGCCEEPLPLLVYGKAESKVFNQLVCKDGYLPKETKREKLSGPKLATREHFT